MISASRWPLTTPLRSRHWIMPAHRRTWLLSLSRGSLAQRAINMRWGSWRMSGSVASALFRGFSYSTSNSLFPRRRCMRKSPTIPPAVRAGGAGRALAKGPRSSGSPALKPLRQPWSRPRSYYTAEARSVPTAATTIGYARWRGLLMASGSPRPTAARQIHLWEASTERSLSTNLALHIYDRHIETIAWSPNGRQLASGNDDQVVMVRDAFRLGAYSHEYTMRKHSHGQVKYRSWSPPMAGALLLSAFENIVKIARSLWCMSGTYRQGTNCSPNTFIFPFFRPGAKATTGPSPVVVV